MTVPPPPPPDNLRADSLQYIVLLGEEGGDWPTLADEVDYLIPLRFHRSISSHRIDSITFRWDLDLSSSRLVDTTTPVGYDRVVDVHAYNAADGTTRRVAWGKISEQSHQFDADSESVTVTARVESWLIGEYRTSGYYVRHKDGSKQLVDRPIVFNPEVEGRLQGNRSSVKVTDFPTVEEVSIWIDPKSTMSAASRTEQTSVDKKWTLSDAVHTLCNMLNPNETFCRNPLLSDISSFLTVTDVDDVELLRNHQISTNLWLGQALDDLLSPYGFEWYLETDDDIPTVGTDKQHSRIAFIKRNDGTQVDVYANRPSNPRTSVDRDNTNISSFHASISIAELVNEINAVTDLVEVESTWSLIPAWPEANDADLNLDDLLDSSNRIKGDDGLTWILNEAGDINGTRTGTTAATTLDTLLNESHPEDGARTLPLRRRRFLPALTQAEDGTPIGNKGYHLEWRPRYYDTADGTEVVGDWQDVDWSFQVLSEQCGIKFTSEISPRLLKQVQQFPDEKDLRLTAVIESDFGRRVQAVKRSESPNGQTIRLEARLPRRFRVRRVSTGSRWYDDRHPAIDSVTTSTTGGSFWISEQTTPPLQAGDRISVINSTGNDGPYTVASNEERAFGAREIVVTEPVSDAINDGNLCLFTDEIDDTQQLQEYVDHLRDIDDAADFSVSISLHGTEHTEYEIGRLVKSVNGRNLTLNANAPSQTERYPQIIGYNVELTGDPSIELVLESFRLERFDFSREP